MQKKSIFALLAIATLATTFVYAQHRRTPPDPATRIQHHVEMLTSKLSLTAAQQQQATALFTGLQQNEQSIHDQMKAAHDSLEAAVRQNDAAGIEQAATTIGNLTAQMISGHAKVHATFLQSLTPDQQAKFNDMGKGMMFGPGMHRGHAGEMMHHEMHHKN